jgi:hypothetical protein
MARVLVPLAEGGEELAAVTVIDLLRCGVFVLLMSIAPTIAAEFSSARMDRDGDGYVAGRELAASGLFQQWDADGDGILHAKEFRAGASLYDDWDSDGNMRLTEDEFYRGAFRHLDRDGDGRLSREERRAVDDWR